MKKLIALSISATALMLLSGCQLAQLKRVRVEPQPVSVSVQVVKYQENVSQRSYVGTVESAKDATICTNHAGILTSLFVSQGQTVKAGQVVASVSSPAIENAYKSAIASLNQAQDGYDRAMQVFESGSIPEVKMVEIKTKLEQAKAAAAVATNALEECNVTIPFDGVISRILVNSGEHLIVAQPIMTIIDAKGLEIRFPVPENEIANLSIGAKATVDFPSVEGKSVHAIVRGKNLTSNILSHTYSCTLELRSWPSGLMVGMICKIHMDNDNVNGIVIPADAVKVDDNGKYVWTVENDIACKRRITLGGYSGKGVLVNSGLEAGDLLIVEGANKVSGGMKVNIK